MKYAIQVHTGPGSAHTACQFIKAALAGGHEILRVFFYQNGVYNAVEAAEGGVFSDWRSLARDHGLDLVWCTAAAERRGLPAKEVAGFRRGGLGLWMEACLKADRVVVFG